MQYSLDNPYPTGTGGASVPGFDATSNGRAQLVSLGHVQTFGDAALNEFHLSYMRNGNCRRPAARRRWAVARFAGIHGHRSAAAVDARAVANVAFNDFTMGVDTTALVQAENIYEVSDAFSRILGKHGLKVGG